MQRYTLRDAIFSSKYAHYVLYRMRFFIPVSLITLTISALEFYLVREAFSAILIGQIVLMRLIVGLVHGGSWGALEVMREFVRGRHSFSDRASINQSVPNWVALSLVMALVAIVVPLPYLMEKRSLLSQYEKGIYDLYLFGFVIYAFLELGIDAYRSGAFAIKRIYRPLRWVIAPGVITLGLFYLFWKSFGGIGLPFAFILGELIDVGARAYFVKETYKTLGIKPLKFFSWGEFKDFLAELPMRNAIAGYFAGICLNIESLLIIIFFAELSSHPQLLVYLFILRQIYHTYAHWGVMFFYYDLKKMCTVAYPPFYRQFLKKLFPASLVVAFFFFFLTVPITYIFYPSHLLLFSAITFLFYMFISMFSYVEIHAFSQNRFADLIFSSIGALAVLAIGHSLFKHDIVMSSFSLLVSLVFIILFLFHKRFPSMATLDSIKKQSVYTLVLNLSENRGGFSIAKVKTNPKLGRKALNDFLSQSALQMDQRGWICPLRSNEFLFIETAENKRLKVAGSHFIQSVSVREVANRKGCLELVHREINEDISNNPYYKIFKSRGDDEAQMTQLFHKYFPNDHEIDLLTANHLFQHSDKDEIYSAIEDSYLTPLSVMRQSSYLASLFYNPIPILYLINKANQKFRKLFHWSKFFHYVNFENFSKSNYAAQLAKDKTKGLVKFGLYFLPVAYLSLGTLLNSVQSADEHQVVVNPQREESALAWAKKHLRQTGVLMQDRDGFVYLKVDQGYIDELFPMLDLDGFEKDDNPIGAHISVFYDDEVKQIGKIGEIGTNYSFTLDNITIVQAGAKYYCILEVLAPELEKLREKYGLSPLLFGNHLFHISIAIEKIQELSFCLSENEEGNWEERSEEIFSDSLNGRMRVRRSEN